MSNLRSRSPAKTDDAKSREEAVTRVAGMSNARKILTAGAMGISFGFLFARSRVFEPMVIRKQFLFQSSVMLKMFIGAVAGSASVNYAFLTYSKESAATLLQARENKCKGHETRTYTSTAVGGALLGAGMAVGGACPGMVMSQVGSGSYGALWTLLGGYVGAFAYGVCHPFFKHMLVHKEKPRKETTRLDTMLGVPLKTLVGYLAVACISAALALEYAIPFESELTVPNDPNATFFSARSTYPALAGFGLGLLQLPALYFLKTFLGTSTSYSCVTGCWVNVHQSTAGFFEYMSKYGAVALKSWWQVIYVNAAILGSYLAERGAGGLVEIQEVGPEMGFLGGFLLLFGSRMGHGCTTGHGISGMPALIAHAFIGVGAMFATGIATAVALSSMYPDSYIV